MGIGWFAFFASKAGCDCVAYVVPFSRRSLYGCGGTGESLGGSPGDKMVRTDNLEFGRIMALVDKEVVRTT